MNNILNLSLAAALWRVSCIDRQTCEIPPRYPIFIFLLGCFQMVFMQSLAADQAFFGMLAAALPLFICYIATGGRSPGGGDVKLMAAAGFYLGGMKGLQALFLGCLFALLIWSFHRKRRKEAKTFALGPYLSAGILAIAFFG